jgi:large subunit ribosomal protein L28
MSWVCELTGKAKFKGNRVSHSNIKTRKFSYANLVDRKWFVDELGRSITVRLSASALKIINARGGLARAILEEREAHLSERLLRLKRDIVAKRAKPVAAKVKKVAEPEVAAS